MNDEYILLEASHKGLSIKKVGTAYQVRSTGRHKPLFSFPTRQRAIAFIARRLELELDPEGRLNALNPQPFSRKSHKH